MTCTRGKGNALDQAIWKTAVDVSREGFVAAAMSHNIDPYEADQFFLSVKEDFQERMLTSPRYNLEVVLAKVTMTVKVENDSRVQRHLAEYRLWLGNTGLVDGVAHIIFRMIAEEIEYQTEVFLRRSQQKILRPIPEGPTVQIAISA